MKNAKDLNQTLRVLFRLWVVAMALGVIGMGMRMIAGERFVGYGSYVPWGLWVALYFHAVGIAGGVFVVGVVGYLLRLRGLREQLPVVLWTSAAALVTGLVAIGLDLGKPLRAYRMLTAPAFTSMMTFNSWMYGVFLAVIAACFVLYRRGREREGADRGWLVPLLMFGVLLGLAFTSQSGVFLGVVEAKPYWNSALLPVLFLAGAIASGSAVLLLIMTFLNPEEAELHAQPIRYLRWVTVGAVATYFVMEFAKISITLWAPSSKAQEPIDLVLFGPFWWVFWLVHLGGGLAALYLLLSNRSLAKVGTGAFLVVLTFVSARLNVLVPGQSAPELRGLGEAFSHPKLSFYYQATLNEYLVALFIGALGVGLVYVGLRRLTGFTIPQRETVA